MLTLFDTVQTQNDFFGRINEWEKLNVPEFVV